MGDLPGQTNLYPVDNADRLKRIDASRKAWVAARLARAEHLNAGRRLRQEEDRALAEFLAATGADAGQQTLDEAVVTCGPDTPPETVSAMKEARRERVRRHAVGALKAAGGHLSNKELASMLNCDAHGLASLLDGDERLQKFHGGREKNEQTHWRLVDAAPSVN